MFLSKRSAQISVCIKIGQCKIHGANSIHPPKSILNARLLIPQREHTLNHPNVSQHTSILGPLHTRD